MKSKNIIFGLLMFVWGNVIMTNLCHATSIENNQIQQGENQMTQEKGLWQHTKEGTVKAWDKTKEVTGDMWKGTKEFTGDVWEGTKEMTGDMWEGTKEFTGDVWEGTKEVGSNVKQAFSSNKNDNSSDEEDGHEETQNLQQKTAQKEKMMPHRSNRHLQ